MALHLSESLTLIICMQISFKLREFALVTSLEVDSEAVINLTVQHFCPLAGNTAEYKDFVATLAAILKAQEGQQNGN